MAIETKASSTGFKRKLSNSISQGGNKSYRKEGKKKERKQESKKKNKKNFKIINRSYYL